MARAALADRLGSEFDAFLFAPIHEESNGTVLRVVSVLARMNLDPWQEASELARLPDDAATRKLTALISALPAGQSARADPGLIAARLSGLLPRQARVTITAHALISHMPSANRSRALTSIILYAIFMLFLLCAQWLVVGPDPPGHAATAQENAGSAPR
jgi:hypothetical protein